MLGFAQMSYSTFIHSLKEQNIQVNRKVLAELAMNEPYSFQALVNQVRAMQGLPTAQSQGVQP
jgi:large subunit ribosomal protein L20